MNLLPGVVEKVTGIPMDQYLRRGLFKEMGITEFKWDHDSSGNSIGMSGFEVRPADLAKLGELVLDKGMWNGKQLIASNWIDSLIAQGQPFYPDCGLLWWRTPDHVSFVVDPAQIDKLEKPGVNHEFTKKVRKIVGTCRSESRYVDVLTREL